MDFLSFISHLQKRVRSGGAANRVHGIGQGHDTSVDNSISLDPSADLPTDAASGYMNADMLDGYHAKQVYQGVNPGVYSGLNADQLDGIDKSLGHVESAANFNTSDSRPATAAITFSGTPKQNDILTIKLYGPDGTQVSSNLTVQIIAQNPDLTDVRTAVKTAISANAAVLSAFTNSGSDSDSGNNKVLTLTTAIKGPRANLYLLDVKVTTNGAGSSLAVDKAHGVYRFTGGGPAEGINADKLDDLHAREHYHALEASEPGPNFVVKPPPIGRGINADTLDSFHGREAYHGIVPDKGTGLNADTLDGVHKLFGHKKDSSSPTAGVAYIELGSATEIGAKDTQVKLTLFGTDGRSPTGINPITFTATEVDINSSAVDNIGDQIRAGLTTWSAYVTVAYTSGTNYLTFTSVKTGERNQYSILIEVTDIANATATQKLKFRRVNIVNNTITPIPGEVFTSSARISLVGTNPVLGVDADMLDGIHAGSGHFGVARDVDGQLIGVSQGINADLIDGLHARVPSDRNDSVVSQLDSGTVKTDQPYIPVAGDGINTDYTPKNPNLDADTVDGLQSRKYSNININNAYIPVADGTTNDYTPKNPNLDADTVDGYEGTVFNQRITDLEARPTNTISNLTATPNLTLELSNDALLKFYQTSTPNSPVFTVDKDGVVSGLQFSGTNITSNNNTVHWSIKPAIISSHNIPEIVVLDSFTQQGKEDWAFTFKPFIISNLDAPWGQLDWQLPSFLNQTSWESASATERGFIKWIANGQKYSGTAVDFADRAGTANVANSVDWDNVTGNKPSGSSSDTATYLDNIANNNYNWGSGPAFDGGKIAIGHWYGDDCDSVTFDVDLPTGWRLLGATLASENMATANAVNGSPVAHQGTTTTYFGKVYLDTGVGGLDNVQGNSFSVALIFRVP